jgi:hypothetical protein
MRRLVHGDRSEDRIWLGGRAGVGSLWQGSDRRRGGGNSDGVEQASILAWTVKHPHFCTTLVSRRVAETAEPT